MYAPSVQLLKRVPPFFGAGNQVLQLTRSGLIKRAIEAYNSSPDPAGAVILINHFSKSNTDNILEQVEVLYNTLIQAKIAPDEAVIGSLINTRRRFGQPEKSLQLIDLLIQLKLPFSQTSFSSLTAACVEVGSTSGVMKLLQQLNNLTFVPSNIIYAQFVKVLCHNNCIEQALSVFKIMEDKKATPTPHMFSSIITSCTNMKSLEIGNKVNKMIPATMMQNKYLQNSLINMYFKCGDVNTAEELFAHSRKMNITDAVTWNIMITNRAKFNKQFALDTFSEMLNKNINIDRQHITAIFNACSEVTIDSNDRVMDLNYASQLLRLSTVFANCISFNVIDYAMLGKAYCQAGDLDTAKHLIYNMEQKNLIANTYLCTSILGACTEEHFSLGRFIVEYIHKHKIKCDVALYTAILNMYMKCKAPQLAFSVWQEIQHNSTIQPDAILLQIAISICAACVAGESLKQIHTLIEMTGKSSILLKTSLIHAYASCANLCAAETLFAQMKKQEHDNITWNAMLKAYATLGLGKKALELFDEMITNNILITPVTICILLNACSHSGLVKEAQNIYNISQSKYNIIPTIEIQNCMVDVYTRSGELSKAEEFIHNHITKPNHVTWITYTAGCRIIGDVERAKIGVEHVLQLYPNHPATLVLKSNLYAVQQDFKGVQHTRQYMHKNNIKKEVGHSWIEVNNKVHSFLVHDTRHPDTEKIYKEIHKMRGLALSAGYKPKSCLVLHDIAEEQKEETLWYHCEKLAVAYGIISTTPGTEIVVKKNLRMCEDCHEATKHIANLYKRKISVSDAARWHVFENGKCSCNDYF